MTNLNFEMEIADLEELMAEMKDLETRIQQLAEKAAPRIAWLQAKLNDALAEVRAAGGEAEGT